MNQSTFSMAGGDIGAESDLRTLEFASSLSDLETSLPE
jgi:hypothetical protein